jgi:hypothetical protein
MDVYENLNHKNNDFLPLTAVKSFGVRVADRFQSTHAEDQKATSKQKPWLKSLKEKVRFAYCGVC